MFLRRVFLVRLLSWGILFGVLDMEGFGILSRSFLTSLLGWVHLFFGVPTVITSSSDGRLEVFLWSWKHGDCISSFPLARWVESRSDPVYFVSRAAPMLCSCFVQQLTISSHQSSNVSFKRSSCVLCPPICQSKFPDSKAWPSNFDVSDTSDLPLTTAFEQSQLAMKTLYKVSCHGVFLQRLRRHTYLHVLHFGSPISATESGLTIPRGFSSKNYFQGSCDLTLSEAASSLNGNAYAYCPKTLWSSVRLPPRLLPDGLVLGGVPYRWFVCGVHGSKSVA